MNGVSVGAVSSYTLTNIQASYSIFAAFALTPTSNFYSNCNSNTDVTPVTNSDSYTYSYSYSKNSIIAYSNSGSNTIASSESIGLTKTNSVSKFISRRNL